MGSTFIASKAERRLRVLNLSYWAGHLIKSGRILYAPEAERKPAGTFSIMLLWLCATPPLCHYQPVAGGSRGNFTRIIADRLQYLHKAMSRNKRRL